MRRKPIAVILSAGASARMGQPKALLCLARRTFLGELARTFQKAGCEPLVVTGPHGRAIRARHPELSYVTNRRWKAGMFSSVRVGLRAALAKDATAVLIHPVDAPRIRMSTVRALLRRLPGAGAILPTYLGQPGHPVVLTSEAARKLLAHRAPHLQAALERLTARQLPVNDPAVVENLNTPEEFRRAVERHRSK